MDNKWSGELGAMEKMDNGEYSRAGHEKVDNELQKGGKWVTRKKVA